MVTRDARIKYPALLKVTIMTEVVMQGRKNTKKGKKNRKHKRNVNSPAMKRYNAENRMLKNKKRKVLKHVRKHPNDKQALVVASKL